ncbi:CBS domain-containing protein [Legionella sp. CNM-4043-24]|uniref:CBS domain-containing protein n=1 Tax=Legionella sp. CNM-4043-24 TaxID=3421646 RepID=UPI00403AE14C
MANLIYSILPNPKRPIIYVYPDTTVMECVKIMCDNNIGALVVRSDTGLPGIVTERDLVRSCLLPGLDPNTATAGEIAFRDVSVLSVNDTVEQAMETITNTRRRHVLVREQGELVAILSIGDLLLHLLEDKNLVIRHLENYITT